MDKHVEYLIFLDIDGTLIDSKYKSNSSELPKLISDLQSTGKYVFLLNSNRSLEDIQAVASQFNLQGLLICENGAYIYNQVTKDTQLILDEEGLNTIIKFKREYEQNLRDVAKKLGYDLNYQLVDTVKYVSESIDPESLEPNENTIFVLDNIYRKYTISSHIREYKNGFAISLTLLEMLYGKMMEFIENSEYKGQVGTSYSKAFGNLLFYSTCTSKATGVNYARQLYLNSKVIAIGDEEADAKMVEGFGQFWTVANGSQEAKKLATLISEEKYSRGVYELLWRLTSDTKQSTKPELSANP